MLQSYKGLMMYEMNKKSMFVAYLLGFVGGALGLNAFYSGENGHGALRLAIFFASLIIPPLIILSALLYLMDSVWTYFWVKEYNNRLLHLYAEEK